MKFEVIRSRKNGRLLMMFALTGHGKFVGELFVEERYVNDLRRHSTVASLLDESGKQIKGLEPLYDAVLTSARNGYWTMSGFERIGFNSMEDFCQSWIMSPLDEAYRPPPIPPIKSSDEAARHVEEMPSKLAAEQAVKQRAKERAQIDRLWPPKAPPG